MAKKETKPRNSFRQLERSLTIVILAATALFVLTLSAGGMGIGWLKLIFGVLTILISGLGFTFLVLVHEHKRRRSLWMLAAFGSLVACTLVSMLLNYPCPPAV